MRDEAPEEESSFTATRQDGEGIHAYVSRQEYAGDDQDLDDDQD